MMEHKRIEKGNFTEGFIRGLSNYSELFNQSADCCSGRLRGEHCACVHTVRVRGHVHMFSVLVVCEYQQFIEACSFGSGSLISTLPFWLVFCIGWWLARACCFSNWGHDHWWNFSDEGQIPLSIWRQVVVGVVASPQFVGVAVLLILRLSLHFRYVVSMVQCAMLTWFSQKQEHLCAWHCWKRVLLMRSHLQVSQRMAWLFKML